MKYAAKVKKLTAMQNTFCRVVIAHINLARFDVRAQEYTQSFAPKYLIAESGDYVDYPNDDTVWQALARMVKLRSINPKDELEWY